MSNEFPAVKTTCTMGFTIQSILEENEDLLKRNPLVAAKEKDDDPWTTLDAQAAFLGPNIWGMSPTSGDLKLDYADLEGLLDDSELLGGSAVAGLGLSAPVSPSLSAPVSPSLSAPVSPGLSAPVSPAMLLANPDKPEPTGTDSVPLTPTASTPTTHQPDAEATSNTGRGRRGRVPRVPVRFEVSPSELALATRPGVDFHPQTHHFSDDELKPQPMCRKSKKQVVPEHRKDQKYWSRRDRNNSAAKRSRETRRLKENQIALRAKFLEKENIALQETMDEITRENERLKARLSACSCH